MSDRSRRTAKEDLPPRRRPTVAEVDLEALAFNFRKIRRSVPRGTSILAVVKADAYGHGSLPVSRKLERLGVDYLGVATPEEGIVLRQGGVKTPILVLGGIFKEGLEEVVRFDLTSVAFEPEALRALSRAAGRVRKRAKIHVKVDTGLGRLGVPFEQLGPFLREVRRLPNLEAEGLLSHFAMAEGASDYSMEQWRRFQQALELSRQEGFCWRYIHMANSANLVLFPECCLNMVRPGILLYGAYPSSPIKPLIEVKPVLTLKTRIHFLKSVPPGSRISYGGTFVTQRESLIATLPIGYADGYSTLLSNRGEVLVRGRRAPVVGRVCMDLTMVDVTEVPGVSPGDEVVLIGRQGRERISADEVAEKAGLISYEVLCSIGQRVPRVYRGT
ncbi:MAG: alanine racemase [Desulfobacterota bacterium]|nr:alanine racemase [Thermodesulfobacteriota bacterium]